MPEQEERTEQATPRRRQKAREEGRIVRSRDLTSIAAMSGVFLVFWFGGLDILNRISNLTSGVLGFRYGRDPLEGLRAVSIETVKILGPFFAVSTALSVLAAVGQGGFVTRPLRFEFERLNPINGIKRLFSLNGLAEFVRSVIKFGVGVGLIYTLLKQAALSVPMFSAMRPESVIEFSTHLIVRVTLTAFVAYAVMAIADYAYERWMFERSLRMTKDEIRQEHKETEGDPLIKSRIRGIQKELARKRMMEAVRKAAVVITNPTHIAVALAYERSEMAAPRVVAKGRGYIAEKIKEIARRHGVPIVEDRPLARALHKVAVGAFIPEELYRAVARILAYIYKLKGKTA